MENANKIQIRYCMSQLSVQILRRFILYLTMRIERLGLTSCYLEQKAPEDETLLKNVQYGQ